MRSATKSVVLSSNLPFIFTKTQYNCLRKNVIHNSLKEDDHAPPKWLIDMDLL